MKAKVKQGPTGILFKKGFKLQLVNARAASLDPGSFRLRGSIARSRLEADGELRFVGTAAVFRD